MSRELKESPKMRGLHARVPETFVRAQLFVVLLPMAAAGDPIGDFMNAPAYQVGWAGKENPDANDAREMMPILTLLNVFVAVGLYGVWRLCKQRKVPFWETMIALWYATRNSVVFAVISCDHARMWFDACTHLILEVRSLGSHLFSLLLLFRT